MRNQSLSRWFPTAVALLVVTGASVLAGERGHTPHAEPVPHVVVDRAVTLARIDAALEDVELLAELTHAAADHAASTHTGPPHGRSAHPGASQTGPTHRTPPGRVHHDRTLRRIDRRLKHLREHLGEIHASVEFGPTVELSVHQHWERPRRVRRPMSDDRFGHFMRQLDDATFERRQLPIVRDVVADHWFTSAQVFRVVKELDNSGGVQAGEMLYPRVVDPQAFFAVYDAFTFDSHATELRRRVAKLRRTDD